jgi:hypothetical protein
MHPKHHFVQGHLFECSECGRILLGAQILKRPHRSKSTKSYNLRPQRLETRIVSPRQLVIRVSSRSRAAVRAEVNRNYCIRWFFRYVRKRWHEMHAPWL